MNCVPEEDWYQPGHSPSLVTIFTIGLKKCSHKANNEDSGQTGWSESLLCTKHKVKMNTSRSRFWIGLHLS